MPTVQDFFSDHDEQDTAARLSKRGNDVTLYYYEGSADGPIPPSVYLQAAMAARKIPEYRKILVNYPQTGWINKNSVLEYDYRDFGQEKFTGKPQRIRPDMSHWKQFSLDMLGAKPNLTSIFEEQTSKPISRARRVYMLTTFCLLKKAGLRYRDRTLGHNIGALLVAKDGEILSWGVNTGDYRHAEVNALIGYFLRNPEKTSLPPESVIFSTLKPCRMCSSFIKARSNGGKTRVWYGMMDEGASGSTPLLGNMSSEFRGEDMELDVFELMSESGSLDDAFRGTGTKPVRVQHQGNKVDLYATLNATGGGKREMSAADWVDKSGDVLAIFDSAANKLMGKIDKQRDAGPMKSVLDYVKPFVRP